MTILHREPFIQNLQFLQIDFYLQIIFWPCITTDLCEPCPENGLCASGKLECFHGYQKQGRKCVEDGVINQTTKKLVWSAYSSSFEYFLSLIWKEVWRIIWWLILGKKKGKNLFCVLYYLFFCCAVRVAKTPCMLLIWTSFMQWSWENLGLLSWPISWFSYKFSVEFWYSVLYWWNLNVVIVFLLRITITSVVWVDFSFKRLIYWKSLKNTCPIIALISKVKAPHLWKIKWWILCSPLWKQRQQTIGFHFFSVLKDCLEMIDRNLRLFLLNYVEAKSSNVQIS